MSHSSPEAIRIAEIHVMTRHFLTPQDLEAIKKFERTFSDLTHAFGGVSDEQYEALVEDAFAQVPGSRQALLKRDRIFERISATMGFDQ